VPQKPAEQSMIVVKANPKQGRATYHKEWFLLPAELISPWIQ